MSCVFHCAYFGLPRLLLHGSLKDAEKSNIKKRQVSDYKDFYLMKTHGIERRRDIAKVSGSKAKKTSLKHRKKS